MPIQSLDSQLLLLINHGTANPLFDVLMPALSDRGYLLILPFLVYMIGCSFQQNSVDGNRQAAYAAGAIGLACVAVYLGFQVEDSAKNAIERVRPCRALDTVRMITACPKSFSMPSGHAISSFSFATPLFYLTRSFMSREWRYYPLALAALVAFSRLYLGVHYPSDVLVGAATGASIGMALSVIYQRMTRNSAQK